MSGFKIATVVLTLACAVPLAAAPALAETSGGMFGAAEGAMSTLFTLLGIAVFLWLIGNLLTGYKYDSRGPKGGPLPPP